MAGKSQLTGERGAWIENSSLRPPSSLQLLKISELGKLGSLAWTSLEHRPRSIQPQQGILMGFPAPCSFTLFWNGHCHWDTVPGRDIFSGLLFSHLYLCSCIHSSPYTADIAEGKAFIPRHWFESAEFGHSRHLWLLDGISRLWESMFHCGVPEKGKNGQVDVWISVKLCMKAWWLCQGSWQDQMDCCKSGLEDQASKQGGLWITLSLTEDQDSNISTRPGERNVHWSHLHHA